MKVLIVGSSKYNDYKNEKVTNIIIDTPNYKCEYTKKYTNRRIYSRANKVKKLKDTIRNDIQYEILILSALGYSNKDIMRLL